MIDEDKPHWMECVGCEGNGCENCDQLGKLWIDQSIIDAGKLINKRIKSHGGIINYLNYKMAEKEMESI